MSQTREVIHPLKRPFIFRPVAFAAIPAAFVAAACFFFWAPLEEILGAYAAVVPFLCGFLPMLVLFERMVRYSKTEYVVRPDRIVVRTGTIFRDRTIELDLENITLVEWKSPFLLRRFYAAGHVTAQEAGSSTQNACLAYVDQPEALYERIAEYMRERGFSMGRSRLIRQEQPGPLGAFVDLIGQFAAVIYTFLAFGFSLGRDLLLILADDNGPSVLQLVLGNYDAFSSLGFAAEALVLMRVGILLLSGLGALGGVVFVSISYIDLLRRQYTLHDDVIDYYDGFLTETRRFIPLENLADTKLTRPFHKRLLGFGDLRISARGSGSDIVFRSLPRGEEFARALERRIEETSVEETSIEGTGFDEAGFNQAGVQESGADSEKRLSLDAPAARRRPAERSVVTRTLKPRPLRASAGAIAGLIPLILIIIASASFAILSGEEIELGSFVIATMGGLFLLTLSAMVFAGGVGVAKQVIMAMATEYSFDERRVSEKFDFLSSRETKFSVDKITSVSILRNPVDLVMGTMTVRIRSIGSKESIDFKHIKRDSQTLGALRRALGFGRLADAADTEATPLDLTPRFSVVEALKAEAPAFLLCVPVWALGFWLNSLVDDNLWFVIGAFALTIIPASGYLVWSGIYHRRIRSTCFSEHLEVAGGIFRQYRHLVAYRDIKAVNSVRYPLSEQGRLRLATGGGFAISVGHIDQVRQVHDHVDRRLSEHPPREAQARGTRSEAGGSEAAGNQTSTELLAYEPHAATEVVRHLRLVVSLLTLPITGLWVYLVYRRALYRVERSRTVAQIGIIYRRQTSVLYDRIDHLETSKNFAHAPFGTCDVEIYTVGSHSKDLVLRSLKRAPQALAHIRERAASTD